MLSEKFIGKAKQVSGLELCKFVRCELALYIEDNGLENVITEDWFNNTVKDVSDLVKRVVAPALEVELYKNKR